MRRTDPLRVPRAAARVLGLSVAVAIALTLQAAPAFAGSTYLVKDINPSGDSGPYDLAGMRGFVYFAASQKGTNWQLWKSDGTGAGTVRLNKVKFLSDYLSSFTKVRKVLYFEAADATHGAELWRTDGTRAGTRLVKDIYPGTGESNPGYLVNVGGTLFFTASTPRHGAELWKSDGTAKGTRRVGEIYPGTQGSSPAGLINVGGKVYFSADDGVHGRELWKSDGTSTGTKLVKDINPTAASNPSDLTKVGTHFFFVADDGVHEPELWRSDGTRAATYLVKDINPYNGDPTNYNGNPGIRSLTNVGGVVFFRATDQYDNFELWKSNGTDTGTVQVANLAPPISGHEQSSNPDNLIGLGGILYFDAGGDCGYQLCRSDGTAGGTYMVAQLNPSGNAFPMNMAKAKGILFFSAYDQTYGRELWRSDGTALGTKRVRDINPSGDSNPTELIKAGTRLFFVADDGTHGVELWAHKL